MTRYEGGAELERAAKRALEDGGYHAIRSAGSKGPVDVYGLKRGEIVFVQCKTDGYMTPEERVRFRQLCLNHGAVCLVGRWEKTGPRGGRTVAFAELTSMGPAGQRPWTPDHGMEKT